MTNCVRNGVKNLIHDCKDLRTEQPNRIRGGLWLAASVVSIISGIGISILGAGLIFGALSCSLTGVGIFGGIALGGIGLSLILSGVPAGLFISCMLVKHSWHDLSAKT